VVSDASAPRGWFPKSGTKLTNGLLAVIAIAVGIHFLQYAQVVILPFVAAVFLSFFANPMAVWLNRRLRFPMWGAIAVVVLAILAVLGGLGVLVREGLASFLSDFSQYESRVTELYHHLVESTGTFGQHLKGLGKGADISRTLAGMVASTLGSALSFIEQLVLMLVYVVFLLLLRRDLPARLSEAFGPQRASQAMGTLLEIEAKSFRYLGLRTMVCLLTGVVTWVILALFGVQFALLWATLTFAAQYIPIAGPLAASVLPVLMALVQFESPLMSLWVALALAGWHFVVGYAVEPAAFGKGMDLNQTLLLFGLVFSAWLWGIVGAILAVPLLVMLRILCEHIGPLRPMGVLLGKER
jgi:predicted PurR-regulated permease PerM